MAKKKETSTEEKPKRERKKKVEIPVHLRDFNDFIKTTVKDMIIMHKDFIKKISDDYESIEEMSDERWIGIRILMNKIHELDKEQQLRQRDDRHEIKRAKYSITERIYEQQRRHYIHDWLHQLEHNLEVNDENAIIYNCYMIFQHLNLLINETSKNYIVKQEKQDKKEKKKD